MQRKRWAVRTVGAAATLVAVLWIIAAVVRWRNLAGLAGGAAFPPLAISSSSFADGAAMPRKLSCDGGSLSPAIRWSKPTAGTKSFVLLMEDTDAPFGFVHWLVYNIPVDTRDLAEGASPTKLPPGAAEGINGYGSKGYLGQCPPAGKHHYFFRLYALDMNPNLPAGKTKQKVGAVVKGHVIAEGKMVGIYSRMSK